MYSNFVPHIDDIDFAKTTLSPLREKNGNKMGFYYPLIENKPIVFCTSFFPITLSGPFQVEKYFISSNCHLEEELENFEEEIKKKFNCDISSAKRTYKIKNFVKIFTQYSNVFENIGEHYKNNHKFGNTAVRLILHISKAWHNVDCNYAKYTVNVLQIEKQKNIYENYHCYVPKKIVDKKFVKNYVKFIESSDVALFDHVCQHDIVITI
jgi:hypothetical protein